MSKGKRTEDVLIDSRVSTTQCKLAVDALLKHAIAHQAAKEQNELLPDRVEQYIWLVVAVKKMFPERKLRPFKIPLSHPLINPRTTPICLITKDPQREYKDLLESNNIKFISRVVGIQKLKGKFRPFEARRMLLRESGLFLADDRVIPLLPKLLGKAFFNAKKQPIPVCLTRKDLKGQLERAVSSTYFHQNQGTCSSVKIGVLGQHSSTQLLQNLSTALPHVIKSIREDWDNVQSIHIKTSSSASLPIWSCRLDEQEGGRWDGLTRVPIPDDTGEGVRGGKKRALESEGEIVKKKKISPPTKKPRPVSQPLRPDPSLTESAPSKGSKPASPATLIKPTKGTKKGPAPESSTRLPINKEPIKVKEKPVRATAVDFFDTSNPEDRLLTSKTSTRTTTASRKSTGSKPSPDAEGPVLKKSKSQGERPPETKTIMKKTPESSTMGAQVIKKRVKFAVKLSDSKTKKGKALGLVGKKVRSGGGKGASIKDRALGKKVAVR